jgi:hypothetical protein
MIATGEHICRRGFLALSGVVATMPFGGYAELAPSNEETLTLTETGL